MSDTYTGNLDVGDVTAGFDMFEPDSGPVDPNKLVVIAGARWKNTGSTEGVIYSEAAELNSDGTVKDAWCGSPASITLAAGGTCGGEHDQDAQTCDLTTEIPEGGVVIKKPAGTYYYGIKTWGETESEPSYPVPDSADQPANAKAWSVVVEEACTCTAWADAECTAVGKRKQTRTCTPSGCDTEERIIDDATCVATGDITKVELDSKLLPEGGTLDWVRTDDAAIKVYFKNTGNVASTFDISVTDEDGATLCSKTTGEIAADGAEYYIDCGTFTPDVEETKTLTAHIDP